MHQDANLLFGVLAVQVRMISAADLIDAAGAWATDPSRDLPDRLVDGGVLSLENRAVLDGLVNGAIEAHHGDATATLVAFGGMDTVRMTMGDVVADSVVSDVPEGELLPTRVVAPLDDSTVPGVTEFPGRYTRQSEHARGGMGRVLLVHDEHLSRDVALKELLPKLTGVSDDDKPTPVRLSMPFVARFLQEARVTSQLEHPAIVPVYELGHRTDGTLYYTMKLVRGRSLEQAIKEAGTLRERLKLLPHVVDLCQAIAYAHSRGVIHRDIKPANVMVGEFGETVVLDWGLAKAGGMEDAHEEGLRETLRALSLGEEAEVKKTAYGQALGTPAYMPPEQAKGQLEEIDERSDVYSLGAVLYELLTGDVPFKAETLQEFLEKVIEGKATRITELESEAPPELIAICEKAMSLQKGQRYESANDLASEVQRFQSGALVAAYSYSTREVMQRFVKKNRPILVSGAVALIAVVAISALYVAGLNRANDSLNTANLELLQSRDNERALKELAQEAQGETSEALKAAEMRREEAEEARIEADTSREDAQYQAYVSTIRLAQNHLEDYEPELVVAALKSAPQKYRGWEWGYLFNRLDTSVSTFHLDIDNSEHAVFLPNVNRLLTMSDMDGLIIWDMTSGARLKTFPGLDVWELAAGSDPDEKSIYFVGTSSLLRKLDVETGDITELFQVDNRGRGISCGVKATLFGVVSESLDSIVISTASGETVESIPIKKRSDSFWNSGDWMLIRDDLGIIVYPYSGEEIRISRLGNIESLVSIKTNTTEIVRVSLSPDGANFAVATYDNAVHLWDAISGAPQGMFYGHEGNVTDIQFSQDGTELLSASMDRTIRIWDVGSRMEMHRLVGHDRPVQMARFGTPGSNAIHSMSGKVVKAWNIEGGEPLATEFDDEFIYKLEGNNGKLYVLSAWNPPDNPEVSEIRVREVSSNRIVQSLTLDREALPSVDATSLVSSISCAPDHSLLVFVPNYKDKLQQIEVWDTSQRKKLPSSKSTHSYGHLSVSEDGRYIVQTTWADGSYQLEVSDALTGKIVFEPPATRTTSFAALIDTRRNRLIWSKRRGPLTIWDLSTGELLFEDVLGDSGFNPGDSGFNWRLRLAPDGDRLILRRFPESIVFNTKDFSTQFEVPSRSELFGDADFDSRGERLFTSFLQGTIEVRDASTGSELLSIDGETNVGYVQFNGTDDKLYAVNEDRASLLSWRSVIVEPDAWATQEGLEELKPLLLRESPNLTVVEQKIARPEEWPSVDVEIQDTLEHLIAKPSNPKNHIRIASDDVLEEQNYFFPGDVIDRVTFGMRGEKHTIERFEQDSFSEILDFISAHPDRFRFVELRILNGRLNDPDISNHRLIRFEFLGVIHHEVAKTRAQWITLSRIAAITLKKNLEENLANDELVNGINMVVTTPMDSILGVRNSDYLRLMNEIQIDGFTSFSRALEEAASELEVGIIDEIVLVFEREETEQVIHVTLKVEEEV